MTDIFRVLLAEKIAAQGAESIAREMGYSNRTVESACIRINVIASDLQLGLGRAAYDFRYSSREFLLRLAQLLGADDVSLRQGISAIERQIAKERSVFQSWIFVETGFRRTSEPIFALAAMEGSRRIRLPIEVCLLTRSALLRESAAIVREHYQRTQGDLPLWGDIREYKLIVSSSEQVAFGPEGRLLRIEQVKLSSVSHFNVP